MNHRRLVLLVIFIMLLTGCSSPSSPEAPNGQGEESEGEQPVPGMAMIDGPIDIDGSINGYLNDPLSVMGATIHLAHDGSDLYFHLEIENEGWIAVGFNESGGGMDGANMIIGYLDNGNPAYRNDLGRGRSHSAVASPGVKDFYISYDGGKAVMEFSYPLQFPGDQGFKLPGLSSGDSYTLIIAAHNSSFNIDSTHSRRGSAEFAVE